MTLHGRGYDHHVNPPRRRALRILLGIMIPLLAFVTLGAWSISSGVASSPDDDFHLPSIWCGLGERPGLCEPGRTPTERQVPASIPHAPCFAFHPDETPHCWRPDTPGMSLVARANATHLYPPLFYAVMSVFASRHVADSVIAMRLFNSALAVGLLTAVFFALPRRFRPALLIGVLGTCLPLGVFLLASTNPSSWAILSAAVTWLCLYASSQSTGRRPWILAGLAVLGAIIGAGARADAGVYAIFGVVLAAILGARNRRSSLAPGLAALAVIVVGAVSYLTSKQSDAAVSGLSRSGPPLTLMQNLSNFLQVPSLWTGVFGEGGQLGWLDTAMPSVVCTLGFAVFAGALFVGMSRPGLRRGTAIALGIAAMWLVPFVLLAESHALVGADVQSRYVLPLMTMTLGVASVRLDAERAWRGARYVGAAAALVVMQAVALRQNLRRYTTGLEPNPPYTLRHPEWWWASAPSPLVVWVGGSVAFAVLLAFLWWAQRVSPATESEPSDGPATPRAPVVAAPA